METGALGGGSVLRDQRTILRCVDWLLAHEEQIEGRWWTELHRQALEARSPRDRRRAIEMLAARVDPIPKVTDEPRGPVTVNVAIVSTERAGLTAQGNGVAIRIRGGNGNST